MLPEILNAGPDCRISNTRVVHAPIELVFRAWTEPQHFAKWWGPTGFSNTFSEFDLRPGGKWRFTMHGPDKGNYENECVFIRIEPPTLIAWYRLSQPLFQMLIELEPISTNETRVHFNMLFESAAECSKIRSFAPEKNEENLDRLEAELREMMNTTSQAQAEG